MIGYFESTDRTALTFVAAVIVSTVLSCIFMKSYILIQKVDDRKLSERRRRRRKTGNLPPVYPNGWYSLVQSDHLHKEDVQYVSALGEHFAVFRTVTGEAKITDAYCPHMGSNIGVGGTVRGEEIECPFHKWRFNSNTGICTYAPTKNKIPEYAKVKTWLCREVNGSVLVWYHAEGEEPSWYPEQVDIIASNRCYGRTEQEVHCHIQEVLENGSDPTHFQSLHLASLFVGGELNVRNKWLDIIRHNWDTTWQPCTEEGHGHESRCQLKTFMSLFGVYHFLHQDVDVRQIGPGYVILRFTGRSGEFSIIQTVTPVGPLHLKMVHRIYGPFYLMPFMKLVLAGQENMVMRDIEVWDHKMYLERPILIKEDSTILLFRRWFSQFYTDNSTTYEKAKETIDW